MDLRELEVSEGFENQHPWELSRVNVIKHKLKPFIRRHKKQHASNPTLVDIGCGDAFLVSRLAMHFNDTSFFGYDIHLTDAIKTKLEERYKTITNLQLVNSLATVESQEQQIDIITLLDVIEHIEYDIKFLRELKQSTAINSKTTVLISVPAYQSLFAKHDTFLGHYRRYNKRMLKQHLEQAGYEIQHWHYFFTSLILPRALTRLMEKKNNQEENDATGIARWTKGKFLSLVVISVLLIDYRIGNLLAKLGIKIPGLSLYCVCRPVED